MSIPPVLFIAALAAFLTPTASHGAPLKVVAAFNDGGDGAVPNCTVAIDAHGNLWGTTLDGSIKGYGVVWEVLAGTNEITVVARFDKSNGSGSQAGVTFDSLGDIWGTSSRDGAYGYGDVWEIVAGTRVIDDVADFTGQNGAYPTCGVRFDADGNCYGTAIQGGSFNDGVVWKISAGTRALTDLAQFDGKNGYFPAAHVTLDSRGNIYGTAGGGGQDQAGVVWELPAKTQSLIDIAQFVGINGAVPLGGVTVDRQGNIFGTANFGGYGGYGPESEGNGVVWEIDSGTGVLHAVGEFDGGDGQYPLGDATLDDKGDLFGTTFQGGADGLGVVWEIKAGTVAINDIATFKDRNGEYPAQGVTFDSLGNMYGTTERGGDRDGNSGTIWEKPAD